MNECTVEPKSLIKSWPGAGSIMATPTAGRGSAVRKGSYGVDAPHLLPVLALLLVANVVSGVVSHSLWPFLGAVAVQYADIYREHPFLQSSDQVH
jgi:hypothetical protein